MQRHRHPRREGFAHRGSRGAAAGSRRGAGARWRSAASAAPTCITTTMAASARCGCKEPMILGHEVSGHIAALGAGVDGLERRRPRRGLAVAAVRRLQVLPRRACATSASTCASTASRCRFRTSRARSARCWSATQRNACKADGLSAGEAAMAEPFSVTLHAASRAGELLGKRVLVTGCGPIGALAIIAARRRRRGRDRRDRHRRQRARLWRRRMGADRDDQRRRTTRRRWRPIGRTRALRRACSSAPASRRRLPAASRRCGRAASWCSSASAAT